MTTNPFPFNVLFWFENDSKIITEIKRTDIQPASADKSLIYKWLVIQNGNGKQISVLTFRSMEQVNGEQIRQFAEGTLTWNADKASFNEEKLTPIDVQHLDIQWMKEIVHFLEVNR